MPDGSLSVPATLRSRPRRSPSLECRCVPRASGVFNGLLGIAEVDTSMVSPKSQARSSAETPYPFTSSIDRREAV